MKKKKINKIAVMTSGGDAPGLNAALHAIADTAAKQGLSLIGVNEGYDGLIDGNFSPIDLYAARQAMDEGGTILHTSRSKRFMQAKGRKQAFEQLKLYGVDACIIIGGNGSLQGAEMFAREFRIPVVGIPKTIDNDIYGTDYTIGFDTATNTIVEAIDKIRDTADATSRIFIVEVMGRKSGYLALYSGLAVDADAIIIPEVKVDLDKIFQFIKQNQQEGHRSMIIVITENAVRDGAMGLQKLLSKKLPAYESRVSILGHIQRGGRPSAVDRMQAGRLGYHAVTALLNGKKDVMLGIVNNRIKFVPLRSLVQKAHPINKEVIELARRLSFL